MLNNCFFLAGSVKSAIHMQLLYSLYAIFRFCTLYPRDCELVLQCKQDLFTYTGGKLEHSSLLQHMARSGPEPRVS